MHDLLNVFEIFFPQFHIQTVLLLEIVKDYVRTLRWVSVFNGQTFK